MTNDQLTLAYNPFEGDFGSPGDCVLRDKIGNARKPGACHVCGCTIQPGTRIRMHAGVYDGQLMSFRWCAECCAAMAAYWSDNGTALEARFALRRSHKPIGQDAADAKTDGSAA